MNRFLIPVLFGLVAGLAAQTPVPVDEAIDGAIARESALLSFLRTSTPVAETYIQDMVPDTDFGTIPAADHYFLGRIDLSRGISEKSYLPKGGGRGPFDLFTRFFTMNY